MQALSPGTRLGPYEVRALLGAGGMGEVYRAYDSRLAREVALKTLPPHFAGKPEYRVRFEREARAIAALDHPNIIAVHSIEEIEGLSFLTMPLVEGTVLREAIPARGLSLKRFLGFAVPIAEAVAAAHDRGVIHRDLKPSNIIIGEDGRLRVLDFGLATLRLPIGSEDGETAPPPLLTAEGTVTGTPGYMSPEQAQGLSVDHRSDVFSMGVLFYEMAAGANPFARDTAVATITSLLRDDPRDLTELRPDLPRRLARIINRCIAKDVRHRYQSTADLSADLVELRLDAAGPPDIDNGRSGASARSSRSRLILIAAAGVVLLAIGTAFGGWLSNEARIAAPAAEWNWQQVTANPPDVPIYGAVISPDGRYVAYTDSNGVFLRLVETGETNRVDLAGNRQFWEISWFPDGTRLLLTGSSENGETMSLYSVAMMGGTLRKLQDNAWRATVSPDGASIVFLRAAYPVNDVWLMTATGESARRVMAGGASQLFWQVGWSPDSTRIAYGTSTLAGSSLRTSKRDGTDERVLVDDAQLFQAYRGVLPFAWLPGQIVFARADTAPFNTNVNLWSITVDVQGSPIGTPRRLTDTPGAAIRALAADVNGARVSVLREFFQPDVNTARWDARSRTLGEPRRLTLDDRWDYSRGHWSNNGRALIFQSNRTGDWDLFSQSIESTLAESLVVEDGDDEEPTLSPDGAWLLYFRNDHLMRRPAGGGPPESLLTTKGSLGLKRLRCGYGASAKCVVIDIDESHLRFSELHPIRGRLQQLVDIPRASAGFVNWDLSHDSARVALVDFGDRVRFIDLHSQAVRDVQVPGWTAIEFVGWAADNASVFVTGFSHRGPRLANAGLLHMTIDGDIRVVRHHDREWLIMPSASPTGTDLAFTTMIMSSNVWLLDPPDG